MEISWRVKEPNWQALSLLKMLAAISDMVSTILPSLDEIKFDAVLELRKCEWIAFKPEIKLGI